MTSVSLNYSMPLATDVVIKLCQGAYNNNFFFLFVNNHLFGLHITKHKHMNKVFALYKTLTKKSNFAFFKIILIIQIGIVIMMFYKL
jgi:hypothetical protein